MAYYVPTIAGYFKKFSGTGSLKNKQRAGGVGIDTADSSRLKYNKAGTIVTLADSQNIARTSLALTGAAIHAGTVGLTLPASAGIITRAYLDITTASTGASTLDIGYTATSIATSIDSLLDGISGTPAALFDSMNSLLDSATNAKAQKFAASKFITVTEASGDATGLVGTLYVDYFLL